MRTAKDEATDQITKKAWERNWQDIRMEEILGIFDDLSRRGVTIVLVTHDPIVARHAHRVIHLKDGRIERIETNDRAATTAGAH